MHFSNPASPTAHSTTQPHALKLPPLVPCAFYFISFSLNACHWCFFSFFFVVVSFSLLGFFEHLPLALSISLRLSHLVVRFRQFIRCLLPRVPPHTCTHSHYTRVSSAASTRMLFAKNLPLPSVVFFTRVWPLYVS